MSKKTLQHKKKTIADINAAREIDGLCAVFLHAFGYQLEHQINKAKQLKKKLINASDDMERYQAWRRIDDLYNEISRYDDNRLETISDNDVDLNSLRNAYIKPDSIGDTLQDSWKKQGATFVDNALNTKIVSNIKRIESNLSTILHSDTDVDRTVKAIKAEYIEPLMKKARSIMSEMENGNNAPELRDEVLEIKTEIEGVYKEKIDPIINAAQTSKSLSHDDKKNLIELKKEKSVLGAHLMSGIYDELINNSVISDKDANIWSNNQEITKSAIIRMRKSGYPIQEVRRDLATYYQLLNGRIDNIRIVTTGSKRASAVINTGTIDIDHNFDRKTLFHEMSHLLESDGSVKEANQSFIKKRATGAPEQLRALTNNRAYSSDEIALPDHFFSPYVGKIYQSGATEVASMGIQQFSSLQNMYSLFESDREMFDLMVGMMQGMTDNQKERQKDIFSSKQRDFDFYNNVKNHIKSLPWVIGHQLDTDEAWESALSSYNRAFYLKWQWKQTLGDLCIMPAKAGKQRKQVYVVENKQGKRHFFSERFLAETYCYLFELNTLGIQSSNENLFQLISKQTSPEWYQYGGELPSLN